MDAKKLIERCNKLKGNWGKRSQAMKGWYDIITLKDELKQEEMESVASNDPRTGYNLGKHLMTSSLIAHKINTDDLTAEQVNATSYLEKYFTRQWMAEEKRYRMMGLQSLISEVVGFMLSTGWYYVFAIADDEKCRAEVWHPFEVYPEFGPDGIEEVVHIYPLAPTTAMRKAKMMGWPINKTFTRAVTMYNYWGHDDDGDIVNGIVMGQDYAKDLTKELTLTRIPVFISPVGGLPDTGSISSAWQEHFGESIVATNADLAKNYNRMLTFSQQLMRDVANPRWFEQSQGETPILREEDMFKRGAIFRGAPGESVNALATPPVPVELRTMLFDYQNMLQRGLFPWSTFGNIQQQMSYLAMANIASAALQVLTPYMDALRGLLGDIDNFWFRLIKDNGYRPASFKMPKNLPEQFEFEVQADIEIPGYLVQRATVARMLDPNFRLPTSAVMDKLFPEIKDPLKAQAMSRRDDAMMHPKAITADMIIAYKEQARVLREANDVDSAILYEKLATSLEAELVGTQPTPSARAREAVPEEVAREVLPTRELTQPQEGLGRISG